MSNYIKNIKIKNLTTIHGCSVISKIIDAELLIDDNNVKIILINNIDDRLKIMTKHFARGTYSDNGVDYNFYSNKMWIHFNEKELSIEI